ncbi:hypothetical protein J2Y38_004548 [Flavobacterium sp. 2755]|nr:hypothetical protein [Flavobacterium sp. 2755]MDR6764315.1 hypothetical protein [Flavobacterium sp. 2755]
MDFNLTEISVINVVFVKEDSRLTIQRLQKGYQSGDSVVHKRRTRNKKHRKNTENICYDIIEELYQLPEVLPNQLSAEAKLMKLMSCARISHTRKIIYGWFMLWKRTLKMW